MNRRSAASSSLPQEIIEAYYKRLTPTQKKMIVDDLEQNEKSVRRYSGGKELAFGEEKFGRPRWLKFQAALDTDKHKKVKLIDGSSCTVFYANGKCYPLLEYIKKPYSEIFLPDESIIK